MDLIRWIILMQLQMTLLLAKKMCQKGGVGDNLLLVRAALFVAVVSSSRRHDSDGKFARSNVSLGIFHFLAIGRTRRPPRALRSCCRFFASSKNESLAAAIEMIGGQLKRHQHRARREHLLLRLHQGPGQLRPVPRRRGGLPRGAQPVAHPGAAPDDPPAGDGCVLQGGVGDNLLRKVRAALFVAVVVIVARQMKMARARRP